jgi:hypothetical protein
MSGHATVAGRLDADPDLVFATLVDVRVELRPQTLWRRLLGRIRHHQLMKSEIPASLAALSTVVTGSARG